MSPRQARWLEVVLAAGCGLLLTLPFRGGEISAPVWVALAPVLWLVVRAETRRWAAVLGFVFCYVWAFASFVFFWHLAAPGVFALALFLCLFYVPGLLLIRALARGRSVVTAVVATITIWPLVETVRAALPVFGFPWLLLGHALVDYPRLRHLADLFGVYGLSAMVAGVNACVAFALPAWLAPRWQAVPAERRAAYRAACMVFALLMSAFAYGAERISKLAPRLESGEPIALIQGNVIQKLGRSQEELEKQLERHLELHQQVLQQAGAEKPILVCWAETMVPGYMNYDVWGMRFKREVQRHGIPTIAGSNYFPPEDEQRPEDQQRSFNAAYLIDGGGKECLRYCKRKLVPFGEYVPFKEALPFMRWLRSVTRDQYTPGTERSGLYTAGKYMLALNICIEDIHPDIAREAAWTGANLLVNVTNDGWFYGNFGPAAHLQAAVWRAIEVRRAMLRVTNTGRTVTVDPLGRVTTVIPEATEGTAVTRAQVLPREVAPRTLFMYLGELGVAALFILCLLGFLGLRWLTSAPKSGQGELLH